VPITPKDVLTDPKFRALTPEQRLAVLTRIDPNFAKLTSEQQQSIVNFSPRGDMALPPEGEIRVGHPPSVFQQLRNWATSPMRGFSQKTPAAMAKDVGEGALRSAPIALTATGLIGAPIATLAGLGVGYAGGRAGSGAGRWVGKMMGSRGDELDDWEQVGGIIGSLGAVGAQVILMHRISPDIRQRVISSMLQGKGIPAQQAEQWAAKIAGLPTSARAAMAERIEAEIKATRMIHTPEEAGVEPQLRKAWGAVSESARPKAQAEGMIRAGRGASPQLTNEEITALRRGIIQP